METFIKESIYYFELVLYYLGFYMTMDYKFKEEKYAIRVLKGIGTVTFIYVAERLFQWLSNTIFKQPYVSIPFQFVVAFGITYLLFSGKLARRIWAYLIYILPGILGEILLLPVMLNVLIQNPLYDIGTHYDLYKTPGLYSICMLLIGQTIVLIWLLLIIATKCWIRKEYPMIYSWLLIFPFFETIMLVMFFENVNKLGNGVIMEGYIFYVFGVVTDIVIVYMTNKVAERRVLAQKLEIAEQQRQLEKAYNNLVISNVKELRTIKHDINNRIQVIYSAIKDANVEKANEILDETNKEIAKIGVSQYCDNYIVNSILSLKKDEAEKHNVTTEIECILPNEISIPILDLCSIYTNILDNAIEGAVKTEKPWVKIQSQIEKGFLCIKVTNSCNTQLLKENGIEKTSKANKSEHGLGLVKIRNIAEKNGGKVDINFENDAYEIVVIMKVGDNG